MKSKIASFLYLTKLYIAAVPRLLWALCVQPFFSPRQTMKVLNEFLDAIDFSFPDHVLASRFIEEIFPCSSPPDIILSSSFCGSYPGGTNRMSELTCLAYLIRVLKPLSVLEIGTFRGRTTQILAANTGDSCHVWTMDLPIEQCSHPVGELYRNTLNAERVTQLLGNTKTFDFAPYYKRMDFVWVDACHEYDFVLNDTEVAIKVCRAGGWIAWHDYRHTAFWSGVTKRLRELSSDARLQNISHVFGTSIVVAQVR